MNAMIQALKLAGLATTPLTEAEVEQQKMDKIREYRTSLKDINLFNNFLPYNKEGVKTNIDVRTMMHRSLVQINSAQLFNILGYSIRSQHEGIVVSQRYSHMTLTTFNELVLKAKSRNRSFSITFELFPQFIKLNLIDIDELNPATKIKLEDLQ